MCDETHVPYAGLPEGRDASVFWQQQLFWRRHVYAYCPCCDEYLEVLMQEQESGFSAWYCWYCRHILFLGRSMTDWLWQRHDDDRFAVWFSVPCKLRRLVTSDGDKLMRGIWQEG
jgi:hypothetical protein